MGQAQSQSVSGRGNVLTGIGTSSGSPVRLVDLPGIVEVEGRHRAGAPDSIRLTNTSGSSLEYSWTGGGGTIPVGASVDLPLTDTGPATLVQLLPGDEAVATLAVSAAPTQEGADFVAQGLMEPAPEYNPPS